jgi:putative cell wall-binding protein
MGRRRAATGRVSMLAGALAIVASVLVGPVPSATAATVTRVAGADRYETAALLSRTRFSPNVPYVYIANGEGWVDALAAGAAAARRGGPVLLTLANGIPPATVDELNRLRPAKIVVAGGPAVIAESVVSALRSFAPTVVRRHGPDRYSTAVAIATDAFPSASEAFVASGESFPDAMTGVPAAYAADAPILLVAPNALPGSTASALQSLGVSKATILGGTAVVSPGVQSQIDSIVATVSRLAGADRSGTSVAVSTATFPATTGTVYLTFGWKAADALAAGPVAALAPGPILLTQSDCVPQIVDNEINRLAPTTVVVIGGTAVTGPGVANRSICPMPPRVPTVSGQTGPAFDDEGPDPYVVRFGSTWYAYTTGTTWGNRIGILTSTASTPRTGWRTLTGQTWGSTALPSIPSWQVADTQWAPGVYKWGDRYNLFYAAKSKTIGNWCLSVAGSNSPAGPFTDTSSGPLICQPSLGGSIDPQPFIDTDGSPWLHWKNNDGSGHPAVSKVWAVRLGLDGVTPYGPHYEVMAKDTERYPWQKTLDNPQMVVDGGVRYLFYAGGNWEDASYVVGYAVCASAVGPCTSGPNPILGSYGSVVGTGGGNAVRDAAGNWYLSYHAWQSGKRKFFVANLTFR